MRWSVGRIFARIALGLVLLLLLLVIALWLKPPDILRVGANYAAKIVCSNVFLAGRDPDEVLRTDVQAPGIALLGLMRVSVDRHQQVVRAGLLGFIGNGLAVARPGTGCTVLPNGKLDAGRDAFTRAAATSAPAPTPAPSPRAHHRQRVARGSHRGHHGGARPPPGRRRSRRSRHARHRRGA